MLSFLNSLLPCCVMHSFASSTTVKTLMFSPCNAFCRFTTLYEDASLLILCQELYGNQIFYDTLLTCCVGEEREAGLQSWHLSTPSMFVTVAEVTNG